MTRPIHGVLAKIGDEALVAWGNEVADYQLKLNGWSPEGLLGRLVRQGPNAAAQVGPGATEISDWALVIDRAVTSLDNTKIRRVIYLWYCSRNRQNQSVCARQARMSLRTFGMYLNRGREAIGRIVVEVNL